jgi:hypothetical protein
MAEATLEQINRLAEDLTPEETYRLIAQLSRRLGGGTVSPSVNPVSPNGAPVSLRGMWKDHFPEDFDIDAVLYEIRHEWEKELDEVSEE